MVYPDKIKSVDKTLSMIEEGKEETTIYEAKEDEDLEAIANSHDMDLDQLLELNPGQDEDKGVKEGERLYVTQRTPYVNVMVEREVLKEERIPFEKKVKEDDELPKGELITEQMGNEGILAFTYNVSETNGKKISESIVKKKSRKKLKRKSPEKAPRSYLHRAAVHIHGLQMGAIFPVSRASAGGNFIKVSILQGQPPGP